MIDHGYESDYSSNEELINNKSVFLNIDKIEKVKNSKFVRKLIEFIENLYHKLFGPEYVTITEDLDEWQNITFDNSIISNIGKERLLKCGITVCKEKPVELIDLMTINGYKMEHSEDIEDSISKLDEIVKNKGYIFIYSTEDLDLDFLKSSFREKCKVFIINQHKINLRYRLNSNQNEVLENSDDNTEADIIVITTPLEKEFLEAFNKVLENTSGGKIALKVLIRLVKDLLKIDRDNDIIYVEYSRKGACNRLVSEYVYGYYD